jgi:hypothetical protein
MREANMELGDVDQEIKDIRRTIDSRHAPRPSASGNQPAGKPGTDLPPSEPPTVKPGETDSQKND